MFVNFYRQKITFENTLVGCQVMSCTIIAYSFRQHTNEQTQIVRRSQIVQFLPDSDQTVERPDYYCGDDLEVI